MKTTELVFILDKSGSMSGLEKDTIGGFNSMLEKQRKQSNPCTITTVLFDNTYELLHDRLDIKQVKNLTQDDYQVAGSTALLDAIGKTINKVKSVQYSIDNANNVLFVIITDGEENSSIEFTSTTIKSLINAQKENNWEFIFLGANIDAVHTAKMFGIAKERTANYIADEQGTQLNFEVLDDVITNYRATETIKTASLEAIREDNKQRK